VGRNCYSELPAIHPPYNQLAGNGPGLVRRGRFFWTLVMARRYLSGYLGLCEKPTLALAGGGVSLRTNLSAKGVAER
jgi:hypothetical protein